MKFAARITALVIVAMVVIFALTLHSYCYADQFRDVAFPVGHPATAATGFIDGLAIVPLLVMHIFINHNIMVYHAFNIGMGYYVGWLAGILAMVWLVR